MLQNMEKELRLRISKKLIEELKIESEKLGLSLSAYVRFVLTKRSKDE